MWAIQRGIICVELLAALRTHSKYPYLSFQTTPHNCYHIMECSFSHISAYETSLPRKHPCWRGGRVWNDMPCNSQGCLGLKSILGFRKLWCGRMWNSSNGQCYLGRHDSVEARQWTFVSGIRWRNYRICSYRMWNRFCVDQRQFFGLFPMDKAITFWRVSRKVIRLTALNEEESSGSETSDDYACN